MNGMPYRRAKNRTAEPERAELHQLADTLPIEIIRQMLAIGLDK